VNLQRKKSDSFYREKIRFSPTFRTIEKYDATRRAFNVPEKLMLELFLQRLPSKYSPFSCCFEDLTLAKAAEISDRIFEVTPTPVETYAISGASATTTEDRLFREIEKLNKRIDSLSFSRSRSPYELKPFRVMRHFYHDLLKSYPSITRLPDPTQPIKHNTVHFIKTNGPPVVAKPRRLAPDRLAIAKSEFQQMMQLGHLRPSSSNYASPLHMVPKRALSIGDLWGITVR
ncbi:transposon Ty3-G Gag-Pol polyprotein, partial [Trichonephila clavipes]